MRQQSHDEVLADAARVMKPSVMRLVDRPEVQAVCILSSSAGTCRTPRLLAL